MAKSKNTADVQIQRDELKAISERYQRISDTIEGEHAVKAMKEKYLPVPSSCTKGIYDERYIAYQTRAVYYNVCQPTRDALVGQIFLRPPVVELPDGLEFLVTDMDGEGTTLEQSARDGANHVVPFGRGGYLTDMPPTNGEITKQDIANGIRPTIKFFQPWAIRNWQVKVINNVQKLSMLVLDEAFEQPTSDNEFDIETVIRQRVYRLTKHVKDDVETYCCSVEIYDEDGASIDKYDVCGADGLPLDGIQFFPVGSKKNSMDIDEPPFTGLSNLNLGHFRNSADYEESVFMVGQPTPVYAGLTVDWMENYFPKGIPFGSRASVTLNEGATAQLLQALPNTLAFEAMKHKEDQMFSIGAKIINRDQKVEKKEKEVEIEAASQKSVLMSIRDNLQMAMFDAIRSAGAMLNIEVTKKNSKLELNENFDLTSADPDELRASSERYQAGEIALSEHREVLVRSGAAKLDLETFKTEAVADKALKKQLQPEDPKPIVGKGKDGQPQKTDN